MKKHLAEYIALILQFFMFYVFPLFNSSVNAMGMVFLIIIATFLISLFLGFFSGRITKLLYPAVISILFLPSVFIYYNSSALVHALWYLVISLGAIVAGSIVRLMIKATTSQFK